MASDSRLSGDGLIWDDCPKLTSLPRHGAVAGFSGTTRQAYPLLLQMANAISSYLPARSGALEFFDMVGSLERVANAMLDDVKVDSHVHGTPDTERAFGTPGDSIIVGGYSRAAGGFALRALEYDTANRNWRFARVRSNADNMGRDVVFRVFGDEASRRRYRDMLRERFVEQRRTGTPVVLRFRAHRGAVELSQASRVVGAAATRRPAAGDDRWCRSGAPRARGR